MAILVNGMEIPEAAIAREIQHHPAASLTEARTRAVEALVLHKLLADEADRLGIAAVAGDATPDLADDPRIEALIAREVRTPEPDQAACRRYYERNRGKFRSRDRYEARHILLACAPGDSAARAAAREKAARIIAALQLDPASFAVLAIAYSSCRSRNSGGSLGSCELGDTVPELETYIMSLGEGELCPVPVESRYGVHVIALERKSPGRSLPFDAVADGIARYLRDASFRTAVRQYLMLLAGQARIEGVEIAIAETPLVQ